MADPAYPLDPGQCVLLVREDALEIAAAGANIWLHQLYFRIVGNPNPGAREPATLLVVEGADVYMTCAALIGDGVGKDTGSRAVAVRAGGHFYACGAAARGPLYRVPTLLVCTRAMRASRRVNEQLALGLDLRNVWNTCLTGIADANASQLFDALTN